VVVMVVVHPVMVMMHPVVVMVVAMMMPPVMMMMVMVMGLWRRGERRGGDSEADDHRRGDEQFLKHSVRP
jgi:hypothetical protein